MLDRKLAHERIDTLFDRIEKLQRDAQSLFPEVEESFTVASFTIR